MTPDLKNVMMAMTEMMMPVLIRAWKRRVVTVLCAGVEKNVMMGTGSIPMPAPIDV